MGIQQKSPFFVDNYEHFHNVIHRLSTLSTISPILRNFYRS